MWTSLHFPQQLFAEEIAAALRLINSGGYMTMSLDHYPPEGLVPGTPVDRVELVLEDILTVRHQCGDVEGYLHIPDLSLVVYASQTTVRLREVTHVGVMGAIVTFESTHFFEAYREGRMPLGASPKYLITLMPQPDSALQFRAARASAQKDLLAARRRQNTQS